MPREILDETLDLAQRLARDAATMALPHLGKPATVTRKTDNSVVTDVDHAIQAHILAAIASTYPDHAIRAEEAVDRPDAHAAAKEARYCWVIDPLDGTRNFTSGFPCFSTSIALLDRGRPVMGVVLEHNLDSLYAAVDGGGTTLNGASVTVDEVAPQSDLLVGVPSSKDRLTVAVLRSWAATSGMVCRNLGSTAWHLALVSSGALAAVFCKQCKLWDVAAGTVIIREAGGCVTDPFGADRSSFDLTLGADEDVPTLAAAPKTHQRLLESIAQLKWQA